MLSTTDIQDASITNDGGDKLAPRFIGPFKIITVKGEAYTLAIPTAMRLIPTFYVGRINRYDSALLPVQSGHFQAHNSAPDDEARGDGGSGGC